MLMFKVLIMTFALLAFQASALPVQSLKKYGEGEMKVLFWNLYKAELFGSQDTYSFDDKKLSLKITYYRDIDKKDLIDATEEQWQHIGYSNDNMSAWLSELASIWPNIKENDVLIVTRNHDMSASFYNQTQLLGTIQDPEFGNAFLSIWLSKQTSRPKLRSKLVGDIK